MTLLQPIGWRQVGQVKSAIAVAVGDGCGRDRGRDRLHDRGRARERERHRDRDRRRGRSRIDQGSINFVSMATLRSSSSIRRAESSCFDQLVYSHDIEVRSRLHLGPPCDRVVLALVGSRCPAEQLHTRESPSPIVTKSQLSAYPGSDRIGYWPRRMCCGPVHRGVRLIDTRGASLDGSETARRPAGWMGRVARTRTSRA